MVYHSKRSERGAVLLRLSLTKTGPMQEPVGARCSTIRVGHACCASITRRTQLSLRNLQFFVEQTLKKSEHVETGCGARRHRGDFNRDDWGNRVPYRCLLSLSSRCAARKTRTT